MAEFTRASADCDTPSEAEWSSVGEGSVTGRVGQAGSGPGKVELAAGETTLMTRVSQEEAATLGPSIL